MYSRQNRDGGGLIRAAPAVARCLLTKGRPLDHVGQDTYRGDEVGDGARIRRRSGWPRGPAWLRRLPFSKVRRAGTAPGACEGVVTR